MQAVQMCGRFQAKLEALRTRHWNLLGMGEQDLLADRVEQEQENMNSYLK